MITNRIGSTHESFSLVYGVNLSTCQLKKAFRTRERPLVGSASESALLEPSA